MSVGERHSINGYEFTETLHGPFGPDRCVDCGTRTMSVVPTGRIGTGGLEEDTGGGVASRCSACGRTYHGVPARIGPDPTGPRAVPFAGSDLAARRAWQDRQDGAGRVVIAEPERTSRDPWPESVTPPQGVRTLKACAERAGWEVTLTYAVGPWLGSRGFPLRQSIGVRCWRSKRFALVFYVGPLDVNRWLFGNALVAGGPVGVYPRCNVTDVREYLECGGDVPTEWFAAITARVEASKARTKEMAKQRTTRTGKGTS
jgi:hypothetical protein